MENNSINDSIKNMNDFIRDPIKIKNADSFERLKNLQLLIQSYSGMKELCK
jgi:hypothetical protein